jgi:alkylation response protein AidB-like acyl-CoA dehydrogenase
VAGRARSVGGRGGALVEPLGSTEEHRLFRRTIAEFCEAEVLPLVERAETDETFPRQLLPAMAALGLFRIGVTESLGGGGGDTWMQCILAEEMGRVCGGIAVSVLPCVLGPALLMKMGSAEQQGEFLEPLMSGRLLVALALTEPNAGSDLFSLGTTARPTGEEFVLNGSKTFITNGPIADYALVAAVRDDFAQRTGAARAAGIHLYWVARDTPGFRAGRKLSKLGMRSSETGELSLDDCSISARYALGGAQGSFVRLLQLLDHTRLFVASISLGLARAAFEASLAYAHQRVTFGQPIAKHQAIAFQLARMSVDLDAARLLIRQAADLYDRGARASGAVSKAKLFATEAAVRITGSAIQIHGGYGYMTELPLERYFRDAKVGTIWEGTSEMQQLMIAGELGLSSG